MYNYCFCIIGKSGSGKNFYLNKIFEDKDFVKNNNLKSLIYGTTRDKRENEINHVDYHFYTEEEYKKLIDYDYIDIIESREYELLDRKVHYFTLLKFFIDLIDYDKTSNIICLTSPQQFISYNNYFESSNLSIKLFPIIIDIDLRIRANLLLQRSTNDSEIYEMCRRIISDYDDFKLLDKIINKDTLIINNNDLGAVDDNLVSLKGYIQDKSKL